MAVCAEARAQRRGQKAAAGGGAYEGEGREGELHGARSGSLVDHYVDTVVLHGGIKIFLHHWTEPVDFVDEENVVFFERGEYAGKVAGFIEHRA